MLYWRKAVVERHYNSLKLPQILVGTLWYWFVEFPCNIMISLHGLLNCILKKNVLDKRLVIIYKKKSKNDISVLITLQSNLSKWETSHHFFRLIRWWDTRIQSFEREIIILVNLSCSILGLPWVYKNCKEYHPSGKYWIYLLWLECAYYCLMTILSPIKPNVAKPDHA